tara:strand:- start:58 stop:258 length:201 start_codon:yes stop_codon:yes gene_type:complete
MEATKRNAQYEEALSFAKTHNCLANVKNFMGEVQKTKEKESNESQKTVLSMKDYDGMIWQCSSERF